jgi:hypothetical protein
MVTFVFVVFSRSVDRRESSVVFWDLTTQEAHVKHISNLKFLSAAGDYCAVVYSEKVDAAQNALLASSASPGGGGNMSTKAEAKEGTVLSHTLATTGITTYFQMFRATQHCSCRSSSVATRSLRNPAA